LDRARNVFGSPDNDIAPDNLMVTPFASGVGGTFSSTWDLNEGNAGTTLAAQLPNILAGRSYINFHTVRGGHAAEAVARPLGRDGFYGHLQGRRISVALISGPSRGPLTDVDRVPASGQ